MAISHNRGYHGKRRNTWDRKRKSLILLSVEGKNKTETQYFTDMARELNLNIRFAPGNYTDPVHMVKVLKDACREHGIGEEPGDKAFCIVDADVNPDKNSQLALADSMSEKDGILLIVSSPCFEVWCLCHYGCSSAHYQSNSAVVEDLQKKLPGYRKNGEGLYKVLAADTTTAIANMEEHGFESLEQLSEACAGSGRRLAELGRKIKETESEIRGKRILRRHTENYRRTAGMWKEYRESGWSEDYRAEHETDIILRRAAAEYFKKLGLKKLPGVKKLDEEISRLLQEKKSLYKEYREIQKESKELETHRANAEHIMDLVYEPEIEIDREKSGYSIG